MAAVLSQEKFETFTGFFAGMPTPTGIAPRLRAAEILWEILWFSASRFPTFAGVFVLIFHQGECHPRE
ncbi:MAG: hypothetical protein KID08_26880, partial [Pseudomonas putida]|nr:hypothetical protein [Pseudomonas putida]